MKHVILFVVLLLLISSLKAQDAKWYKITKNDLVIMSFEAVSGAADGVNQAVVFHKLGADDPFWDFKTSWQRKYKDWPNDKSEAFPFSKTLLVGLTDGYHMTRMVGRWSNFVAIGISFSELKSYPKGDRWKVIAKKAVLSYIANRGTFTIVYNSL